MAKHHRSKKVVPEKIVESASEIADPHYKEDIGWTRLTQTTKDLPRMTHTRHLQLAHYLWQVNPLAKRIIELTTEFTVGGTGISYSASNPRVKDLLDRFWKHNRLDESMDQFSRETSMYGEQVRPIEVMPMNGAVLLGYLAPGGISTVKLNNFTLDPMTVSLLDGRKNDRKVIALDNDPRSPTYGRYVGDTFLFQVNKVRNMSRGFSDLLSVIDWIDCYEELLFSVVERSEFMSSFVWDVVLKGAPPPKITQRRIELEARPPKKGGFIVHNENEEWSTKQPDWRTPTNLIEAAQHIRSFIIIGAGFPRHWFEEEDVKAVAAESNEVGARMVMARQNKIKQCLTTMFDFAIDQALIKKYVKPKEVEDRAFTIEMPEVSIKDITRVGATLSIVVSSLALAESNGWIEKPAAAGAFAQFMKNTGISVTLASDLLESCKAKTWKEYYARNSG